MQNVNSTLIKVSTLSAAVLPAAGAAAEKNTPENDRPNIVVIVADDLLSSELSCYGGRNLVTRNIDRLAQEGVRFTHNYASTAMSVPIRASMYTGLYPARHGSFQNHKETFAGTKTVNEYMAEEGYRVGRTGKIHPITPSVYKFEEIPGFTVGCTKKKAPYTVDGIREFITRNDNPFLLYVCSINPHAPWTWGDPGEFDKDKLVIPQNCVDNPRMREIFTHYLAEVRALDNEVGSVVEVLKQTGKLDNMPEKDYHEKHLMSPNNVTGVWPAWKMTEATDPKARFLIDRFVHRPEFEFYDVENDPWEMTNLADKPEYRDRIKKMKKELVKWMKQQGDTGAAMDVEYEK